MSNGPFRPRYFLPGLLSATVPDPQLDPQSSPLAQPGNGPIAGFTNTFGLNLVNFDWITWHNYEWENWIVVDALLNAAIGFLNIKGFWKPATDYLAGQSVFDPADITKLYLCLAPHTSGTDFDAEKPLYWKLIENATQSVSSVFGRIGDVIAAAGDYAAFYANKATTDAHIARTDNPHGTSWGNLGGKPATFPPSAHTHVEADITDLDKYTKAQVDAKDASIRTDFAANDAALLNNINTRLPLAGGTMTGFLLLHASPTALMHAATKGYVDGKIAALPPGTASIGDTAPVTPVTGQFWYDTTRNGLYVWNGTTWEQSWPDPPPGTAVGPTPPASPDQGQLWYRTVEPVGLFIWYVDADSSQWVQIGGGSAQVTDGTPIGTVSFFAANVAPPGWLICNNQPVTTAYPELRQYLLDAGSPYGVSGTDPRVPELRGEFVRGHVGGRTGVDDGRVFGSFQADGFKSHQHSIQGQVVDGSIPGGTTTPNVSPGNRFNTTLAAATGGTETRPRNVALLPCIKAFDTLRVEGSAEFNIATNEQVIAGTSTDTLLTPANVRALSGAQLITLTGITDAIFNQVPYEANEIDLILNGLGQPANGAVRFDWSGAPAARAFGTRSAFFNNTVVGTVGDDNSTVFNLDVNNAAWGLAGMLHLSREFRGGAWGVSGSLRRAPSYMLTYAGVFAMNGEQNAFLRLNGLLAFTSGAATARWRI